MTRDEKERSFLQLVPRIRLEALKAARRYGGNRDDLIQESFLAAWAAMDAFDPSLGNQLWTFIGQCVRYRLMTVWNAARAKSRQFTLLPYAAGADAVDHRPVNRLADFDDLLAPCLPREREYLAAIHRDGLTIEQIAASEGISHQCVAQVAKRGRERIQRKLSAHWDDQRRGVTPEHRRELRKR